MSSISGFCLRLPRQIDQLHPYEHDLVGLVSQLREIISFEEIHFIMFCPPVRTNYLPADNGDLEIGLRVQERFLNFKPVTLPEPSLLMLVVGRKGSSWDEMGM